MPSFICSQGVTIIDWNNFGQFFPTRKVNIL
jgi:hypothetical protein